MDAILRGTFHALPSKSRLHRLLISAALGRNEVTIPCSLLSRDTEATVCSLNALGAEIAWDGNSLRVKPIVKVPGRALLPCGESASTLRFLLPVAAALGSEAEFQCEGKLASRPMEGLLNALSAHGAAVRRENGSYFCVGQLTPGVFAIPGNVSSQFVSGLLFALPLLGGDSEIRLTSELQSAPYVEMTLSALREAGIKVRKTPAGWQLPGGQRYALPSLCRPEGDWSDAAFFLAAGALAGKVTVSGLDPDSLQGDRQIADYLKNAGARITFAEDGITAEKSGSPLQPFTADLRQTPDLAPVLAVLAAAARGTSHLSGCERLRDKESDRAEALRRLICDLGGSASLEGGCLTVCGRGRLKGGSARSFGDHRIAMAAALCGLISDAPVTVDDPGCVGKSHPGFFDDLNSLKREVSA